MAAAGKKPPDATLTKFYKCHAQTKVGAVLCLETREQVKQEIIKEINLEKLNNKQKGLNDTVYEDYGEIETFKIENQLQKQLNNELQDKNKILNELLNKEKEDKNNNNKTYEEITVNSKLKSKRVPKLIIKKNRQQRQHRLRKGSFTTS